MIGDSDDEVERSGLSVILRKNKLEDWNEDEEETDFLDGLESTHLVILLSVNAVILQHYTSFG